MSEQIDTSEANDLVQRLHKRIQEVNGASIVDTGSQKEISTSRAKLGQELLFISHICDKVRTLVMDEYWLVRGRTAQFDRGTKENA